MSTTADECSIGEMGMLRYFLIILLTISLGTPAQANQQEMREKQCRYQWVDKGTWTAREERLTAGCVVNRWGVIGGLPTLIRVGDCESGWYRFASNAGNYLGIFQHAADYWMARVTSMMPDAWKVGPWWRWTNPRSQIVTTVRMVNGAGGWGAWVCA